jgi:hypothetical protein
VPPALPESPRAGQQPLASAIAAGAGVLCAVNYAQWVVAGRGWAVDCRWLRWTGLPCPGCGATRCLAACGRFDFATAWHWHPLVTALALAGLAWPLLLLVGRSFGFAWPERMIAGIRQALTGRRVLMGIAAHWLYLCWAWPR